MTSRRISRSAWTLALPLGCLLSASLAAQSSAPCQTLLYADSPTNVVPPPDWFSGDTHDHIQLCSSELLTTEDVLARMIASELDLVSVLVWDGVDSASNYTSQICRVTGEPEETPPGLTIQYGMETSGLDCASWGHLIGLGVGPDEAYIASSSTAGGGCYNGPGLGLGCPGGDGTGIFSAPVADSLASNPGTVRGLAHQAWATDVYADGPLAFDWYATLVQTGVATDYVCLDPARGLASPIVEALAQPGVLPPFGPMDVALGKLEFLETVDMENDYSQYTALPARWHGMYYKLLSAGLRIGVAAGTDADCANVTQRTSLPRTYVRIEDGSLSFDGWTKGLAEGKTSLAMGNDVFLDLQVNGLGIGSQLEVTGPGNRVEITATLRTSAAALDTIEIIENGRVVASQTVSIAATGGSVTLRLPDHPLSASAWLAARLCSGRAHTGATYVNVDNRAIASCEEAEYWMVWCDLLNATLLQYPGVFPCQTNELLTHVSRARSSFKSLRDYAAGFDPSWFVERIGESTPSCRGPITIGLTAPVVQGNAFTVTCHNAPPRSSGFVFVSDRPAPGGVTSLLGLPVFFDPASPLTTFVLASSAPNGYAETKMPAYMGVNAGTTMYLQYIWNNTADCGGVASFSASDALEVGILGALTPVAEPRPVRLFSAWGQLAER